MRRFEITRLRCDLWFAKLMLWLATFGRDAEPTPETHLYLADLHFRLAFAYERARKWERFRQHRAIANEHAIAGPPPEPRPAAAMAMPVPQPFLFTDARGRVIEDEDEPA